jgi:hypothetical protein
VDLHPGALPAEGPDDRGHRVGSECRQATDHHGSRLQLRHGGHGRLGGGDVPQDLAGRSDQCLSGGGEPQLVTDPVEQPGADFPLEFGHRLRQARLGQVVGRRRLGEAAVVDHGQKERQLPDIHN